MAVLDRFGGAFGKLFGVGDKVVVTKKDAEFGSREGRIVDFEKFPGARGVDVKFSCGTVARFNERDLRRIL